MASGERQSNPFSSGDAGGDHNKDYGDEYGPPLPTRKELREMEHRRLVSEATNTMLNVTKDPNLAKYMTETTFQDVHAQWKATTTSPPNKKQYSEKELEEEVEARLARILGAQDKGNKHDKKRRKSTDLPAIWSIVSDHDPRMTSLFWRGLFENMDTTLKFTSSFHPQTAGQSEEANFTVLDLLKCYVSEHKEKWEQYLPLVEYAYNNTVHSSTGKASFEIVEGGKKFLPYCIQRTRSLKQISMFRPYVGDVPEDMPVEDQSEVEKLDEILVPEQILAHKERKVKGKVTDDLEEENPLSRYTVGQSITAKILRRSKQIDDGSSIKCYDLTIKPSELGGEGQGLSSSSTFSLSSLQVGQVVTAYIREVQDDWAWLLISPSIMGRLFVLDSSTDPIQLGRFKARYKTGQAVRCRIEKIDRESGKLDFSLRDLDPALEYQEVCEVKINDVLGGRVSKVLPGVGGLGVQIGSHIFGRVHISQLHDIWKDNPALDFKVGQFVKCIVLDVSKSEDGGTNQVDLSLRQSLINAVEDRGAAAVMNIRLLPNPTVEKMEDLSVGMEVQGFVKSIINKGCFVTLSRHLDARIKLSNLAETFINDPGSLFPVGKLVKGRVISLEPLSGFVEMSLRSSFLNDELNNSKMLALKEIHVGDMVTGVVTRVESYGIFISISNSKIVGLCHISQVSDSRISNLEVLFKLGDRLQAKVSKVNEDKKQISLGMKDTYIKEMHAKEELTQGQIENSQHEESLFEQVLDTDVPLEKDEGENKDDSLTDGLSVLPLSLPDMTVFDSHVEPLDVILDTDENMTSEDVVTKEMDSPMRTETKEKSTKRLKKRVKNLREAAIREAEQKRLNGDEAPESSEDFEKLVHGSPNSSFIWIKYMAFLLSLGDIEKARAVADRALQVINFREEGEKLNVWVALLNLENAYGNPAKEATLGVFNRALQYCDPKKLYLALLGIYERSGQHDMVDELLKTMLQKFKMSCKVWLKRVHNFLRQSMPDAAHKTLDRALLSLPQRKHIKAISQAAIAEFKIGSAERARNLFESILRNYPKRVDLWNVYLDQETVLGDSSVIRALFERVTSLELPPKKMKFLFKKYLEYEKTHGNEERVDYVKGKAMQYVETRIG
ncbi:hypothetical protein L7F22_005441 [Adiantum nelumboides]|nr:hypothetical protein [Adiantum nelumboides]